MNNNYRQLRNRKVEIVYEGRTPSSDPYSEDEEYSNPSLPRTSSPLNSETQEGGSWNSPKSAPALIGVQGVTQYLAFPLMAKAYFKLIF
uniref:Uncharacterized protein n=1 Tax=Megaselia scalaris TaxID=36166 RepID=T1H426_MEGSC